ncbi:unnamed protein product [Laminaria digitata]
MRQTENSNRIVTMALVSVICGSFTVYALFDSQVRGMEVEVGSHSRHGRREYYQAFRCRPRRCSGLRICYILLVSRGHLFVHFRMLFDWRDPPGWIGVVASVMSHTQRTTTKELPRRSRKRGTAPWSTFP